MKTILLYGELGNRFGKEHKLHVRSTAEAIQALCTNFPDFKKMLKEAHKFGIGFKVFVGRKALAKEKESLLPSSDADIIRIAPAIFGSGDGVRALVGLVLVVAGAALTIASAGAGSPAGASLIKAGILFIASEAYAQLSTPPKPGDRGGGIGVQTQSFLFSGPENVTRQGGAVPVGYGRMMIGSTVISASIEDVDQ